MLTLWMLSLLLAALPALGQQQVPIVYDSIHNATSLVGTWSTGSGAVSTGAGFANPSNYSFSYPDTTGRSFSFTGDMFFEQAEYTFTSNATDPHCITGVMTWQHGTYELLPNGSIVLHPYIEDGRQQVQDPCAAVSNQITQFSVTVLFQQWRIYSLPTGGYHLHLFQFDNAPLAPMNLIAQPPNMLPTISLTNTTAAPASQPSKRALRIQARSGGSRSALVSGGIGGLAGLGALVLLSL